MLFRLSSIEWRRFQKYLPIRFWTLTSQSCKVHCIFREIEVLKYFKICLLLIFTEKFDSFIIELNGKIKSYSSFVLLWKFYNREFRERSFKSSMDHREGELFFINCFTLTQEFFLKTPRWKRLLHLNLPFKFSILLLFISPTITLVNRDWNM